MSEIDRTGQELISIISVVLPHLALFGREMNAQTNLMLGPSFKDILIRLAPLMWWNMPSFFAASHKSPRQKSHEGYQLYRVLTRKLSLPLFSTICLRTTCQGFQFKIYFCTGFLLIFNFLLFLAFCAKYSAVLIIFFGYEFCLFIRFLVGQITIINTYFWKYCFMYPFGYFIYLYYLLSL